MARIEQDGAFVLTGIGGQGRFAVFNLMDVLEYFSPTLLAFSGVLGGHFRQQPAVGDWQARQQVAGVGKIIGLLGVENVVQRTALKRRVAGEEMIEREAQRIDVGAAVGFEAFDLLGSNIRGSALDVFGGIAGGGGAGYTRQAQVRQLHRAIGTEQNVAGLDVAVDQGGFAPNCVEGAGNDLGELEGLAVGHALVLQNPLG